MRRLGLAIPLLALALGFGSAAVDSPCSDCLAVFPIVDESVDAGGYDWTPNTTRSCEILDAPAKWANYCRKNGLTTCPELSKLWFERTNQVLVAVAVDTISPVTCDGVGRVPAWEVGCITRVSGAELAPRVEWTEAFNCFCSSEPQFPVTRHIVQAVRRSFEGFSVCTPCLEKHDLGCQFF